VHSITIERVTALVGRELEVQEMDIHIEKSSFVQSTDADLVIDGIGMIAVPGFVDAHVHLADAMLKDAGVGLTLDELFHPVSGIKNTVRNAPVEQRVNAMRQVIHEMAECGITTAANFLEEGRILPLLREDDGPHILHFVRPERYFSAEEIRRNAPFTSLELQQTEQLMDNAAGLGLSGCNEYSDAALSQLSNLKGLRGIHAAESSYTAKRSLEICGRSEVERACTYFKPHFVVHLVSATEDDLMLLKEKGCSAILCPRSNGITGSGFPPVNKLLSAEINLALGTDNAMLNSPDMFREMEYFSRYARSLYGPSVLNSREILKMATVNGAAALKLEKKGAIAIGMDADLVLLDAQSSRMRESRDIYASIVHRASQSDVLCTIRGGNIIFAGDKMEKRICSQG